MLKRLETDRSLATFSGQFVPLKLTTDGNPQWSQWTRKYPHEGQGIPIIYVIRADGKKLFARTGSLPGSQLPQLLVAARRETGRLLNASEADLLGKTVSAAEETAKQGDVLGTARLLSPLKKIGKLGALGSFAPLALKADELAQDVFKSGQASILQAQESLADDKAAFDGLLYLHQAETAFAAFPQLKSATTRALSTARRRPQLKDQLDQARLIARARRDARSKTPATRKRAADVFRLIIERYPNSSGATLATRELDALSRSEATSKPSDTTKPEPDIATDKKVRPAGGFRTWTDRTGKFSMRAKLVAVKGGKVTLVKQDGKKLDVVISQLSDRDKQFLEKK